MSTSARAIRRFQRPDFAAQRYFWLGVLGTFVILALLIGSSIYKSSGLGQQEVKAEFLQAAGMRPGDKVDVAGVEVGSVKSSKLAGDHIVTTLAVKKDLKLGPDAKAAIKMSTILGKIYVDLVPGNGKGLKDDTIKVENTQVPYNLAKVVNDPEYKSQFERVERLDPEKIAESLNVLDQQLGDSPKLTAQALDSVGVLAKVVNQRKDEVDGLLKNLNQVSQVVDDNRNNVLLLVTQGQAIGQSIMDRQALIQRLMDNTGTLSKQLQEIGGENNGQLAPLIQQLNTMSEGLEKNNDNLSRLLQIMPVTVRQLNNAFGTGPYGDVFTPWLFPDNWLCFAHAIEGCQG